MNITNQFKQTGGSGRVIFVILLAIVLSVLRFTTSYYPSGIFKHFLNTPGKWNILLLDTGHTVH
jgi:hypothetical protein